MKKYPLTIVEWLDHSACDGENWMDVDDLQSDLVPHPCQTIGWIIKEDALAIWLAAGIGCGKAVTNIQCILKGCITRQTFLEDPYGKPELDKNSGTGGDSGDVRGDSHSGNGAVSGAGSLIPLSTRSQMGPGGGSLNGGNYISPLTHYDYNSNRDPEQEQNGC